jgi:uncharacterized DUF497 family protein
VSKPLAESAIDLCGLYVYAVAVPIEWDPGKSLSNLRKHGVSFDEAAELFEPDADCLILLDDRNSETEQRFISIGPTGHGIVVAVSTQRPYEVDRLISARRATRREAQRYLDYKGGDK